MYVIHEILPFTWEEWMKEKEIKYFLQKEVLSFIFGEKVFSSI